MMRKEAMMALAISDELLNTTRMTEQELSVEIAVMLFQQEKLTLGQASKLAGMNQFRFQNLLAGRDIGPHYDVADFQEDIETLKKLGRL
jgi:predicted HTH domain antitoxin